MPGHERLEDDRMMTCRQVATLVSSGRLADQPLRVRLGVWLHLSMCRHCRRFRRQLRILDRGVRALFLGFERDMPADLERRLTQRLSREA